MHSIHKAGIVASMTFAASVIGMLAQKLVPAQVLAESRGTVGAMIGLITLLLALVLGLLVYTAFAVFTTQQSEAESLGPLVVELDLTLEQYGADAASGRAGLRATLQRSRARFFGDAKHGPKSYTSEETRATLHGLGSFFDSLRAATDTQKQLLASARDLARKVADTQMLMARQLANPFPPHVLVVVVCWAAALFLGNGFIAVPNVVTVVAHLAASAAIGSAIFLILELSQPYTGFIRLSPAGVDRLLQSLGEVQPEPRAA